MKTMGFKPFHTDRIIGNHGYFSNTDEERVKDLNEMFANTKIDGILCARGGYGCTRIMHMIDFENIRRNPKALIGFSDITTLLNGIYKETGQSPFTALLEAPYRIDRMLTQLIEGKNFKKAAGILFGVCAGCNASTNPNYFSLKEVIMDRIRPLNIPAVYGRSFGHVENNFTFPIGITAKLETQNMTLQLLEKAVK